MKRVPATLVVAVLILGAVLTDTVSGRDVPADTVYKPQGLLGLLLNPFLGFGPFGRPGFLFGPFGGFGFLPGLRGTLYKGNHLNAEAVAAASP